MIACCVEGCVKKFSSDFVTANNEDTHSISFHRFPRNEVLRRKWLIAILRPDWDAPDTAYVCSRHFSSQQLEYLSGNNFKIKDKGYPDRFLPIESCTIEASQLKVCRFCLATKVKMYGLQSGVLKTCLETIVGLHENHDVNGLPQYLCYICAAYLMKMYNVIEKSMIAQATLLEIYAENFEITKDLIFEQNRKKLNLVHSLQIHNTSPCTVYNYVYDDNLKVSHLVREELELNKAEYNKSTKESSSAGVTDSESEIKSKQFKRLCEKLKQAIDESEDVLTDTIAIDDNASKLSDESNNSKVSNYNTRIKLNGKHYKDIKTNAEHFNKVQDHVECVSSVLDDDNTTSKNGRTEYIEDHDYLRVNGDDNKFEVTAGVIFENGREPVQENKKSVKFTGEIDNIKISEIKSLMHPNKKFILENSGNAVKARKKHGSNIEEPCLENFYNIIQLTLEEQNELWLKSREKPMDITTWYRCGICSTWVRCGSHYLQHVARHDPKSGDFECQVCKVRFTKEHLLKKHLRMTHERKYICKTCSETLYNTAQASHHRIRHEKSANKCRRCGREFTSIGGLRLHMAVVHRTVAHRKSKNKNVCKACNVKFKTEVAHREHWVTCSARGATPSLLEDARATSTCGECGLGYGSRERLAAHARRAHGPGSHRRYPAKCDHCDVVLRSRVQQRSHMMVIHPEIYTKNLKDPRRSVRLERKAKIISTDNTDNVKKEVPRQRKHTLSRSTLWQHRQRPIKQQVPSRNTKLQVKQTSSAEVAFECPICDYVFTTTARLNQHILDVHQRLQFTKSLESPGQSELLKSHRVSTETSMEIGSNIEIREKRIEYVRIENKTVMKEDSETDTCSEGIDRFNDNLEPMNVEDPLKINYGSYKARIGPLSLRSVRY